MRRPGALVSMRRPGGCYATRSLRKPPIFASDRPASGSSGKIWKWWLISGQTSSAT